MKGITRSPENRGVCSCDPRHIEIGGFDSGCPVHDRTYTVCDCAPDCEERILCDKEGLGHQSCGWCENHSQAMHLCQCRLLSN